MNNKYKLRWQDHGILIMVFIALATIVACVADGSNMYYKRVEEDRALQAENISQSGQEIAVKANFSMVNNPHYGKLVYQTMTTA